MYIIKISHLHTWHHHDQSVLFLLPNLDTVPSNHNFTFTRLSMCGTTPYFAYNLLNSFVEILFFQVWHFHETWYFLRHSTSTRRVIFTRCDNPKKQNTRSIFHADVLLSAIRDPSSLAIELCNTCLLVQPSINFSASNVASCHVHVYAFHRVTCMHHTITDILTSGPQTHSS